jgi:phosphoglycerol transferase MdoB-like AlkP superfamily enzyme
MRYPSPAQRLSRTANLAIFLGLLYTVLHLLGSLGLLHGYHFPGLVIALGLLGLGYGIRYGSSACLYMAMAICAGLSLYFGALLESRWTPYYMLRLGLSTWACWRLCRAIPAMRLLQQEQAFPLPMSRYGELFLRRLRTRPRRRGASAR